VTQTYKYNTQQTYSNRSGPEMGDGSKISDPL
jgi:hypothetical protein